MKRVLLVDDDAMFRNEFKECFDEFGVREAGSGEEALQILSQPNEIDLVVLDVRLSGMNGIETLNKIRKMAPQVHIVILTGYGSKDVAVQALRGRADDYIEKPMVIEATRKTIEKFLGATRGQPDTDAIDLKGKIARVKSFVQRNILRKVTLKDAAEIACLSQKYLSRAFKQQTRLGFNEFKLSLKIEEAKNFLTHSGYNVNQISDKLGYENPESFIRQFKKMTGQTPTDFRLHSTRNVREKILTPKSRPTA